MAALDGTFALAQMNDLAVLIAQNLKFDVSRIFNEALGVNVGRAKGLLRLAARRFVRGQKFFLLAHHPHAATAAACNRLQNQREANFRGFFGQLFFALDRAIAPWNRWQTRALHLTARAILFAHHFNYFRSRANKRNFRRFADLGEIGVFREKSVTRVNGVNIGDLGSADYVRNIQITFTAAWRADTNRFISKPHMQRIAIRLRVHGNRGDSQLLAVTNHPQGNFAAIRYQNFFEHNQSPPTSCGSDGFQTMAGRIRQAARSPRKSAALPRCCRTQSHSSVSWPQRCTTSHRLPHKRQSLQKARRRGSATHKTYRQWATLPGASPR